MQLAHAVTLYSAKLDDVTDLTVVFIIILFIYLGFSAIAPCTDLYVSAILLETEKVSLVLSVKINVDGNDDFSLC